MIGFGETDSARTESMARCGRCDRVEWAANRLSLLEVEDESLSVVCGVEGHRASLQIYRCIRFELVNNELDCGLFEALTFKTREIRAVEVDDTIAIYIARGLCIRGRALCAARAIAVAVVGVFPIGHLYVCLSLAKERDGDVNRCGRGAGIASEVLDGPDRAGEGIRFRL